MKNTIISYSLSTRLFCLSLQPHNNKPISHFLSNSSSSPLSQQSHHNHHKPSCLTHRSPSVFLHFLMIWLFDERLIWFWIFFKYLSLLFYGFGLDFSPCSIILLDLFICIPCSMFLHRVHLFPILSSQLLQLMLPKISYTVWKMSYFG